MSEPQRRRGRAAVNDDPFAVLGLPATPELTDDDVRGAWRRIAAATHPDREDGGDPERFALAAAAYTELRTRHGRGEAYADLTAGSGWPARGSRPARGAPARQGVWPAAPPPAAPPPTSEPASEPDRARAGPGDGDYRQPGPASLVSRIRRGRPAVLALRLAIAAGVSGVAFWVAGGVAGAQPAAAGLAVGAVTWLLLTARHDLAPPRA